MDAFVVFAIQSLLALAVYGLLAWWYVWPRLTRLAPADAQSALLFVHAFRFVGLSVLVPSVVGADVPRDFASTLAIGDVATAILAVAGLVALRLRSRAGIPLAIAANAVGALDLANVTVLGVQFDVARKALAAFWYVPTLFVPALWVAHVMAFGLLLRRR